MYYKTDQHSSYSCKRTSGNLFTNGRTTVPVRTPVVRHWYHTVCYSRGGK